MSEHPAAKRHRAYAQAVEDAYAERGYLDGHRDGYAAGVQAARDAVAGVEMGGEHFWSVGFRDGITIALAAIDALRGEQS